MSDTRNKRSDGVRTLEDLRLRCVIDSETGCWLWRGAMSQSKTRKIQPVSRVWLPEGLSGDDKPTIVTASKAAWVLSGRRVQPGQAVWREHCGKFDCINPAHGAANTRKEMFAAIAASDRLKGRPARAVVNAKNRASTIAPVERVRQAEAMFADGKLQKEVQAALNMASNTARKIRRGLHPNSAGSGQRLIRGASVFSIGAA